MRLANLGSKGLNALCRRRLPPEIDLSIDRAVGNPGWCLTVDNRLSVPVTVSHWGVMRASDAPSSGRRVAILPEEHRSNGGPGRASYRDLSIVGSGSRVPVDPLSRVLLVVGRSEDAAGHEAMDAMYRDDKHGLVAWASVETVGVVFSRKKKGGWARSDAQPVICKCGHPHRLHEMRTVSRRRWRFFGKRIPMHVGGSCRSGGEGSEACRCTKFRRSPKMTANPLRYLQP